MTATQVRTLAERLVGAWELVSYVEIDVETGEKRNPMGLNPTGFILYTNDGYMSAQIQAPGRPQFTEGDMFRGTAEEYKAAGTTYLAYSGPYRVDEGKSSVTHFVEVSLFPNWAAKDQVRLADLYDDKLKLRFEQPQRSNGMLKTAELTWQRCVSQAAST